MDRKQEWQEWMNTSKIHKLEPITRTQSLFADFMFANEDEFNQIGDVTKVFESIYSFLKQNR